MRWKMYREEEKKYKIFRNDAKKESFQRQVEVLYQLALLYPQHKIHSNLHCQVPCACNFLICGPSIKVDNILIKYGILADDFSSMVEQTILIYC